VPDPTASRRTCACRLVSRRVKVAAPGFPLSARHPLVLASKLPPNRRGQAGGDGLVFAPTRYLAGLYMLLPSTTAQALIHLPLALLVCPQRAKPLQRAKLAPRLHCFVVARRRSGVAACWHNISRASLLRSIDGRRVRVLRGPHAAR
jgi:hypothetical protein